MEKRKDLKTMDWTFTMGETVIKIMTRLFGLILAVMAVQFVINGVRDSFPEVFA